MSCSARLPVYAMIAGLFFGKLSFVVIFSLYLIGIAVALFVSFVLQKIKATRSPETGFIMEMPPYRAPSAARVVRILGTQAKQFVVRIGTVIFAMSVIAWLLSSFSFRFAYVPGGEDSMMAVIGGWIAVIFKPLGFGSWRPVSSLLVGLMAKEAVAESMMALAGDSDAILMSFFGGSGAAAYAFLVFVLLYVPCLAAVGSMIREAGGRWTWLAIGIELSVAYLMALTVYWLGTWLVRYPGPAWGTLIAVAVLGAAAAVLFNAIRKRNFCSGCPSGGDCSGCHGETERRKKL
jgi:ferrous iron transport protein B